MASKRGKRTERGNRLWSLHAAEIRRIYMAEPDTDTRSPEQRQADELGTREQFDEPE